MKFQKYIKEKTWSTSDIENYVRDELSGTPRKTNANLMFQGAQRVFKGLKLKEFMDVWKSLIADKFLVKVSGNAYKWEM